MLETMRDLLFNELRELYPGVLFTITKLQAPGYAISGMRGQIRLAVKVIESGVLVDAEHDRHSMTHDEWGHRRLHALAYEDPKLMEVVIESVDKWLADALVV